MRVRPDHRRAEHPASTRSTPPTRMAGDPVAENALGYLMRNAQWLVQAVGVDGFRIDAAKHVDGFVLDYLDRAVYRANPRTLLDGSTKHVFSFSEVFDGNPALLLSHVKKNINPNDPGRIGGNRDTLDFKLYFALKDNLEQHRHRQRLAEHQERQLDFADDGLHNGSPGVMFVNSHDVFKPFAPQQRRPRLRADACRATRSSTSTARSSATTATSPRTAAATRCGGATASADGHRAHQAARDPQHPRPRQLRRTLGRHQRPLRLRARAVRDRSAQQPRRRRLRQPHVHERRLRATGTYLIELTGNAANARARSLRTDIPEVIQVFSEGDANKVNVRFRAQRQPGGELPRQGLTSSTACPRRSRRPAGGLPTSPQTLAGDDTPTNNFENGHSGRPTSRSSPPTHFTLRLSDQARSDLLGSIRDVRADGDNALLKIDGGLDVNGNGQVDFVTPGTSPTASSSSAPRAARSIGPGGLDGPRGDGEFLQNINAAEPRRGLPLHHRPRLPPPHRRRAGGVHRLQAGRSTSTASSPVRRVELRCNWDRSHPEDRDLFVRSTDQTANAVHVFMDLPAALTERRSWRWSNGGNKADADRPRPVQVRVLRPRQRQPRRDDRDATRSPATSTSSACRASSPSRQHRPGRRRRPTASTKATTSTRSFSLVTSGDTAFNAAADFNGNGLMNGRRLAPVRRRAAAAFTTWARPSREARSSCSCRREHRLLQLADRRRARAGDVCRCSRWPGAA